MNKIVLVLCLVIAVVLTMVATLYLGSWFASPESQNTTITWHDNDEEMQTTETIMTEEIITEVIMTEEIP